MEEIIAAVDIGTKKTVVLIAENLESGLCVRGMGMAPSEGVVRGVVVNVEHAELSVLKALAAAEKNAQLKVRNVSAAFGGNQALVFKSHSITNIAKDANAIRENDLARLMHSAKTVAMPENFHLYDCVPCNYQLDGQNVCSQDVMGQHAQKIEGDFWLFAAPELAVMNFNRTFENRGFLPEQLFSKNHAAALGILTTDEMDAGVLLIDIGAGTTEAVCFSKNMPIAFATLPFAGESVTHDLTAGLKLSRSAAEKLKHKFGCALESEIVDDEILQIATEGGNTVNLSKRFTAQIIEARVEEIFVLLRQKIMEQGVTLNTQTTPRGIVLCGGSARIGAIDRLAAKIFELPIRIAGKTTCGIELDMLDCAVALGVLKLTAQKNDFEDDFFAKKGFFARLWASISRKILSKL